MVLGNPVTHSLSPAIQRAFAQQFGFELDYGYLEVTANELSASLQRFVQQGGKGLNVSSPYKQILLPQISNMSARAKQAQAINTITVQADGSLYGDNTDGVGFVRDLQRLAIPITQQRILILGAGGAVRGILPAVLELNPGRVTIANRDLVTARQLVASYKQANIIVSSYAQLHGEFDLVVNATSAGLNNLLPPLPAGLKFKNSICYDLNYGSRAQSFLNFSMQDGAKFAIDGMGMLLEQAAEAFYLWHNLRPQIYFETDHISAFNVL